MFKASPSNVIGRHYSRDEAESTWTSSKSCASTTITADDMPPQLTARAAIGGLLVGTLLCFTNMHFGLQTGWVTMGSIQAAVVGFIMFRLCPGRGGVPFSPHENVALQTVSVATATMPLAGGFVGIVPALGLLSPAVVLSPWQQLIWCAALTYFGIFFAVPLRRQTILVEQLPFPSGTATAKLIELLHAKPGSDTDSSQEWLTRWRCLFWALAASFLLALAGFFQPALANLKVGSWIGFPALTAWHWTLRPSLAYVGQGMIMGPRPAISMLGGAVTAWAFLGPLAKSKGWAPGPITAWEGGAQGWLLWVAVGLMLAESLTSLVLTSCEQLLSNLRVSDHWTRVASLSEPDSEPQAKAEIVEVLPRSQLVADWWWRGGLIGASIFSVGAISPMLSIPHWQTLCAVVLSCLVAVLAVRALGQTDLNPVSGVGKLSQVMFALLAPGQVVANIVAGALAEAGAMQAGDLLQDLKTGHLLGASPRAQFFGQLLGASVSVLVTVAAYQLYENTYGVPSEQFPAPVAHVWKDMALLMRDGLGALPTSALQCATAFAVLGAVLPVCEHLASNKYRMYLPMGMAFGIGMYLLPEWTLPRVAGALVNCAWRTSRPESHEKYMLMIASGFVLGEGCMAILGLIFKAWHVPTFGR